ncbi:MAG: hypothetical protein VX304_06685 [Planctomycetota bacterium]|nr:hypothetical protein [Planctomycetota bacterium]
MNQITRGRGQARRKFNRRKSRLRQVAPSRMPGVLVASLGLAALGATVMWLVVPTAEGASGSSKTPVTKLKRERSTVLVSTVTSGARVPRGLTESGVRRGQSATRETVPVTIVRSMPFQKAKRNGAMDELPGKVPSKMSNRVPKKATRRGRLPRYYGKIGVSPTQKRKIYSIQETYRIRVKALTRELEELRGQERKEMLAVLTTTQKQRLSELIDEAEAAREARLRAREKKQSRPAKPSVPGGPS